MRIKRIVEPLPALMVWTLVCASLPAQRIVIPERVAVDQDQLTLGQIAEISPHSPELAGIALGYAPYPGHYRWLERSEIENALHARNVDLERIELVSPEKSLIMRQSQLVASRQIETALTDFFNSRYADWNIRILRLDLPQEVILPEGRLEIRVDSNRPLTRLDNFTLRMDFYVDGRQSKSQWVRLQAEATVPVVVMARDAFRGDVLADSDVERVALEVQKIDDLVTDLDQALGTVLKSAVSKGEPLRHKLLDQPTLVKRGDIVTLIARGPAFQISTTGKARSSGTAGEIIEVENLDSRHTVRGTITGVREVQVLTGATP